MSASFERPYDWSTKLFVGLHPRAVFQLRLQVALHETTPPRGRGQPPSLQASKHRDKQVDSQVPGAHDKHTTST